MVHSLAHGIGGVARRWRLSWPIAVAALSYLLLLVLGGSLLNDADTYWQIALGDWILAHRDVPHVDTFSLTMTGTPWISSQWLAQILFAKAFAVGGWTGVVALTAAAIALALALLAQALLERLAVAPALILTGAAFVIAAPHIVARPHALAMPVMVAFVAGLVRSRDTGRMPSYALLPLLTLWANLHGGFTFGLAIMAPLTLEALLVAPKAERVRVAARWMLYGVLALAAACITPYGPESILVTARVLGLGPALALIGEWQPQSFAKLAGFELCLLLGIGFALYRGLTLPPIRLLIVLGLLHMALAHVRNADLLALLAPLFMAAPLAPQVGRAEAAAPAGRALFEPAAALVIALTAATFAAGFTLAYQPRPAVTPTQAVAALKASGAARVLNSYDFGGYLIASGIAPFIDGRTELYGRDFVLRHHNALTLRDIQSFFQILQHHRVDATLLAPETPAIGLPDRMAGWKRIYADDLAVVHVRVAASRTGSEPP
jgi:hypothetical protein